HGAVQALGTHCREWVNPKGVLSGVPARSERKRCSCVVMAERPTERCRGRAKSGASLSLTLDSAMPIEPSERRIDAFFYGLFMDESTLRQSGVTPVNPRRAYVDDFALRIGQRATLVPHTGARAFGMLLALTHAGLQSLYSAPGLEHYRPEAVLAQQLKGPSVPERPLDGSARDQVRCKGFEDRRG